MDEEELRGLVAEHQALGEDERRIVADVFDAGDRLVAEAMRPRPEVVFFDGSMSVSDAVTQAVVLPHSRYPVVGGSVDEVVGFVHVRDVFAAGLEDGDRPLSAIARPIVPLPDTKRVLDALTEMQREGAHIAVVVDEYGGTAGIVTLEDLMEELVGEIWDEYDEARAAMPDAGPGQPLAVEGRWILEEFADRTGIELPQGQYETVAGFVMAALGHVPVPGESVQVTGGRLEVTEVAGWRVVRLSLVPDPPVSSQARGRYGGGPAAE